MVTLLPSSSWNNMGLIIARSLMAQKKVRLQNMVDGDCIMESAFIDTDIITFSKCIWLMWLNQRLSFLISGLAHFFAYFSEKLGWYSSSLFSKPKNGKKELSLTSSSLQYFFWKNEVKKTKLYFLTSFFSEMVLFKWKWQKRLIQISVMCGNIHSIWVVVDCSKYAMDIACSMESTKYF